MLLELRRVGIHQREILLRLARGEFAVIPEEVVPFYRDVYDHFLRVSDLLESYRDLVTSALDAYLSVQSNRTNEIMKTLTLISTVMLPITFIAGVYGMNFKFMPELESPLGYPLAIAPMGSVVCGSLLWFRRRYDDRWHPACTVRDFPDDEVAVLLASREPCGARAGMRLGSGGTLDCLPWPQSLAIGNLLVWGGRGRPT